VLFYAGAADARTADAGTVALAFNVKCVNAKRPLSIE